LFSANNAQIAEEFFVEEAHLQTTLDGFEQLWQITEAALPTDYKTPLEKLIEDQKEEILYLSDVVATMQQENFQLRQEMALISQKTEYYETICSDYSGIVDLNRALTKQLNQLMSSRDKQQHQLQALKTLLA
jgi:hypothetical protein